MFNLSHAFQLTRFLEEDGGGARWDTVEVTSFEDRIKDPVFQQTWR